MKRIGIYVLGLLAFQSLAARPIENLTGKTIKPKIDRRAGSFANTCDPASQSVDLDINNVRTKLLNGGDMWWDINNPKYEVPKINDPNAVRKHSLFSGAIWIGGKDNGGSLKLAAMTYRQNGSDFWPGPLDTSTAATDPLRCKTYDKMWKVTRDELEEFANSKFLTQSAGIRDWPAGADRSVRVGNESEFMAPFKDINGNNLYEPMDGEHPVIDERRPIIENGVDRQPDMFIWWVYNDKGNIHSETTGQAIGIECQTTAFAFSTNDEVNNMTFYTTKIINRGFTTLNDCYMGQWVDADLGNYADDYVGCDVGRGLGYCYNGDDDDEGVLGYGLNPPTIGVDYFEGPTDTAGAQMGLSHFMYYNNTSDPVTGNPRNANAYYNFLMGKWAGGQNVTWGGNGFGGSRVCDYMFPGSTDPAFAGECWDEKSAGNRPGDRRFIQSTGPFLLRPGQVQRITVGVVWARTTSGGAGAPCLGTGSLRLLQLASDKAQTLFNNNFKILDGPNAPDIEIQELNQELVMKFLNTNSSKVENYKEIYKDANNKIKTYKFEGYLVYQLKDATVNTGDLENVDKARLLFQGDIKNNRGQIINRVFDPKLAQLIPVEKVDGSDKGVQHTYSIKNDLFSTSSNTRLIDFKKYYYLVMSYAILSDDSLQIDPNQFLAGRRNIKVYATVPHNPIPENFGTELNSGYGSGPSLNRIAGRGNGGNALEFTKETIDTILKNGFDNTPTYIGGAGPVNIKVVDPLKVPNAKFELYMKENKPSNTVGLRDSITKNTQWIMVKHDPLGNDTIFSDTTLAYRFESVQGKKGSNNRTKETLADWGLSIEITQTFNPGENGVADPSNGLIDWSVEWEDNGKQWLTAVVDNDAAPAANPWTNWIRAGNAGRGAAPFDGYAHDFFLSDGSTPVDPGQAYERIWNGRIAPYGLTAREKYSATTGANTYGFAWSGNATWLQNPMAELNSFELVITKDKSKWTRCPVIEMGDDEVKNSTEGQMAKFNMRWGTSKDKEGADIVGNKGLGWFPGYAINLETGERLAIAFGEDSYLAGENGRDMIWNPTDNVFNDNGNYPAIGGKHFIYIFGTGRHGIARNVQGFRYLGEGDGDFTRFRTGFEATAAGGSPSTSEKTRMLSQVNWVIPTYLAGGYKMLNGVPPTDVKIKVRVKKAYTTYASKALDGAGKPLYTLPRYEFDAANIAPKLTEAAGKKSLDMVNVVPNPYRGYSEYENSPVDSRVKITNLPPTCTITIFDMAGNLIRKIKKDDNDTYYQWDLKNNSNVPISSGLYLIHVKAKDLGEKVVRWYGIMHAVDLDTY
jgi:hypothetical protein